MVWRICDGPGLLLLTILLASSMTLAYLWATLALAQRLRFWLGSTSWGGWLLGKTRFQATPSWWKMLQVEQAESYRYLTCSLKDGRQTSGWLHSFNNRLDEVGDRDIVLSAPIKIHGLNVQSNSESWQKNGSAILSSRDVTLLQVEFFENPRPEPSRRDIVPLRLHASLDHLKSATTLLGTTCW